MIRIKSIQFIFLLFILFFAGCSNKELPPKQLIQWVNNPSNGLIKSIDSDKFKLTVQYKPLDYIISQEQGGEPIIETFYSEQLSELNGLEYFKLKITSKTGEEVFRTAIQNEEEYYNRMNYFLSNFQYHINLKNGQDTLPCKLYHFERNYGAAPFNNILLAFENIPSTHDKELLIDKDCPVFDGMKFHFSQTDISRTPKLKLTNL